MKKKILFISDFSFHIPGGAQKSMEVIMEGLCDNYDFYVLMPGSTYKPESEKYKCICLEEFDDFLVNDSVLKSLKIIKAIRRVIKQLSPDIIHAHMLSGMAVLEILKVFRMIKGKVVYTERGVADQYSKINRFLIRKAVKNFDGIVVTTNYNQKLYSRLYNAIPEKTRVIPNTAGSLFEEYNPMMKRDEKQRIGFTKKVVMFNARLSYAKNWEMSLDVIKWINQEYDYQFIVVVGTDRSEKENSESKKMLEEIQECVGSENLCSYVNMDLSDLSRLYYAADVFIMTSRSESFGRTAVEAMSRSVVVFGTKIDGLSEVIGFDDYKFTDLDDFKEKFRLFESRGACAEQARFLERFRKNYTLETNLTLYDDLYKSL